MQPASVVKPSRYLKITLLATSQLGKRRQCTSSDLCHHQTLDDALMLWRYHSPVSTDLTLEEGADLIAETCSHINEFMEVLHKLMTFLEHGKPKRRGPAATKVAARDIKPTVLREVDDLTNR
jgi:hypothetical protein